MTSSTVIVGAIRERHSKVLIAAISAVLAGTASAGEAPGPGRGGIEEIVVTAQRREEQLQDVPIAITVATEEQIRRDQIYTLTDLNRITPGLEISQTNGGENNGGGRVRGIGTAVTNSTAAASVAIVVDQVPQGNVAFSQLYDLAQIEVLRGPQGTLFGQTASAGVINVTTAAPDPKAFSARASVDYSDKGSLESEFGQRLVQGSVNIPVTDNSALRLATSLKEEEGVQKNVFTNQESKLKEALFRARYLVNATDALTLNLIGEYNKEQKDGDYFYNIAKPPTNPASLAAFTACGVTIKESAQEFCADGLGDVKTENYGITGIIDWDLGGLTLTSVTGYRNKQLESRYINYTRLVGQPQANLQRSTTKSDQLSEELRISSSGEGALGYTAGVFFSKHELDTEPLDGAPVGVPSIPVGFSICVNPLAGPCNASFTDQHVEVESRAIFADLTYALTEGWSVFGGARYTEQDTEAAAGAFPSPGVSRTADAEDDNVSGRLGLRWTPNADTMVYLSAARGFKGSMISINNNPAVPIVVLDPEISKSFELGTKMSFLSKSLALDANIFYTTVSDYQAEIGVFVGTQLTFISSSVPELKSKGIEIDLIAVPTENIRLNAGYIYNVVEYPDNYFGDDGIRMDGKQYLNAPKNKLSLSGEYAHALTDGLEGFFSVNAVYKSDLRLAHRSTDLFVYPAHTTIGATIGARSIDGKWSASLYGRNITGEDEPGAYGANTFLGQLDGGVRAWNDGSVTLRQVGLSLSFNF